MAVTHLVYMTHLVSEVNTEPIEQALAKQISNKLKNEIIAAKKSHPWAMNYSVLSLYVG